MKRFLLNLLMILAGAIISRNELISQTWTAQTSGTSKQLRSVSVVDDQVAWVVGDSGAVLRTTNGGIVWQTRASLQNNVYNVAAIDSNIALICVNPDTGFIYRTNNGGISWARVYATSAPGFMDAVYMINSSLGYALGDPVAGQWVLLKTTNAGITWTNLPALAAAGGEMGYNNCFEWTGSFNGWFGTNSNKIYRTTNSGTSWTSSIAPGTPDVSSLSFSAAYGIAGKSSGQTLRSTDYGASWVSGGLTGTGGTSVSFTEIPNATWWASSGNNIYKTTDAGVSWALVHTRGTYFNDIRIRDYHLGWGWIIGYAVGNSGQISKCSEYFKTINNSVLNGPWSDPGTWSLGVPKPWHDVVIYNNVTADNFPFDSINGLNLDAGGILTFDSTAGLLKIGKNISFNFYGASLVFPPGTYSGTGLKFYGNWKDSANGIFVPGASEIISAGDNALIWGAGQTFSKLTISGNNTSTLGNITISKNLFLNKSLSQSPSDTIFIENNDPGALQGTGIISRGTIVRKITGGSMANGKSTVSSGRYRFESENSFIQFASAAVYPSEISLTTFPNDPSDTTLFWQLLEGDTAGGVANADSNFVEIDSLGTFSTVRLTKPTGELNKIDSTMQFLKSGVSRQYIMKLSGGSNFKAKLRLRYEPSEVDIGVTESTLKLARGPVIFGNIQRRWNMVSVPVMGVFPTIALFPNSLPGACYRYSGYVYLPAVTLYNGAGYWLKFPSAQSVGIAGDCIDRDTIDVINGWNMIGAISIPVPVSFIDTIPPVGIRGIIFGYGNGYYAADSLKQMKGYWIKTNGTGKIVVSRYGFAVQKKLSQMQNVLDESDKLSIKDASGNEQILYLSGANDIDTRYFEMPPLPPQGIFDVRFSSGKMLEKVDETNNKFPISISSAQYPITICFNEKQALKSVVLVIDGKEFNLGGEQSVQLSNSPSSLILKVNSLSEIPKEFALYQNYPNPFNPSTYIKFDLPKDAYVTMKIYNIIGQEIAEIIENEFYKVGRYSKEFRTQNIASGVYFYKLIALAAGQEKETNGQFRCIKKMVILR